MLDYSPAPAPIEALHTVGLRDALGVVANRPPYEVEENVSLVADVAPAAPVAQPATAVEQAEALAAALAEVARLRTEALRLRAEVAQQTQERDAFISLAAHELRSPLTTVKGYAQLLARQARKTPLAAAMARSVEAIEQQASRMSDLVGELHDATRIRRGDFEVTPLNADLVALAAVEIDRRRALAPEHTLLLLSEAPSLLGQWDGQRLSQIIRDLLDNATRFSPDGSIVVLRIGTRDGAATLSVRDQGIGVARADRELIFDYLYRAPNAERRNLSGLGLGLYVSRAIAERMGGRLWLAASETAAHGGGSEFRLTLPIGQPAPTPLCPTRAEPTPMRTNDANN